MNGSMDAAAGRRTARSGRQSEADACAGQGASPFGDGHPFTISGGVGLAWGLVKRAPDEAP